MTKEIARPKDGDTATLECYMGLLYVYSISEGKNNLFLKAMNTITSAINSNYFIDEGMIRFIATDNQLQIKFINDATTVHLLLISPY